MPVAASSAGCGGNGRSTVANRLSSHPVAGSSEKSVSTTRRVAPVPRQPTQAWSIGWPHPHSVSIGATSVAGSGTGSSWPMPNASSSAARMPSRYRRRRARPRLTSSVSRLPVRHLGLAEDLLEQVAVIGCILGQQGGRERGLLHVPAQLVQQRGRLRRIADVLVERVGDRVSSEPVRGHGATSLATTRAWESARSPAGRGLASSLVDHPRRAPDRRGLSALEVRVSTLNADEIQGDIAPGFRRSYHPEFHQAFIPLRMTDPAVARGSLRRLLGRITWSSDLTGRSRRSGGTGTRTDGRPDVNIAFTSTGLRQLAPELGDGMDDALDEGLARRSRRFRLLGAPDEWVIGRDDQRIDAMLNVGSTEPLDGRVAGLIGAGFEEVRNANGRRFIGKALPGGIEHFGFRDGLSQPRLRAPGEARQGRPGTAGSGPPTGIAPPRHVPRRAGPVDLRRPADARAVGAAPEAGDVPRQRPAAAGEPVHRR